MDITLLAAVGAMVFWGIGDFFIQRSTRRIGSVESLFFIGLVGSVGLLPFVINDIPFLFTSENMLLLAFLGVLTFVVAMFNFEGLKLGKLSVIDVLLELELPITVALGIFLLGETLSLLQLLVILAIILGCFLIATQSFSWKTITRLIRPHRKKSVWQKSETQLPHWKAALEKGAIFAILGAMGMGLLNFVTAVASKGTSPLLAIWAPSVIFTLISLVVLLKRREFLQLWRNAVRFKEIVVAESVFDVAAWVLFAVALFEGAVSITTAVTEAYPAIALLLGVWINKEKIVGHQYAGAGIALAACIVLAIMA